MVLREDNRCLDDGGMVNWTHLEVDDGNPELVTLTAMDWMKSLPLLPVSAPALSLDPVYCQETRPGYKHAYMAEWLPGSVRLSDHQQRHSSLSSSSRHLNHTPLPQSPSLCYHVLFRRYDAQYITERGFFAIAPNLKLSRPNSCTEYSCFKKKWTIFF